MKLILVIAVGYLAARVAFDWLARHLLIISGAEYLVLGFLAGPRVTGVLGSEALDSFAPFLTLAIGWLGVRVGMELYFPALIRVRGVMWRLAFVQSLITLTLVAAVSTVALSWLFHVGYSYALLPSLVLGAVATCSASQGIQVMRGLGREGPLVRQLEVASGVDAFVAIVTVAAVFSLNHVPTPGLGRTPTAVEWVVIDVLVGLVGGGLFHLFLGEERNVDRLFIALAGAIIFITGAATYLQLSPVLPGMLLGMILVNTSRARDRIQETLGKVARPLYFVLLICGGAIWQPGSDVVLPVLLFLCLRYVGKVGGARLAARANGMLPVVGPGWGRALLGQGGLAIALALNYLLTNNAVLQNIVFTAAVASVLLTDLLSARLVRSALEAVLPGATEATAPGSEAGATAGGC